MKFVVTSCRFKRFAYSKWEKGIVIGAVYGGSDLVIDKKLRKVNKLNKLDFLYTEGLITFEL